MTTVVSLTTVQAVIARALAYAPCDRSRIQKAASLILLGYVEQLAPDAFSVRSLTDPSTVYRVQPDACECKARVHFPDRRCSHEWACRIVVAAELDTQRQAEQLARQRFDADRVALVFASASRRVAA